MTGKENDTPKTEKQDGEEKQEKKAHHTGGNARPPVDTSLLPPKPKEEDVVKVKHAASGVMLPLDVGARVSCRWRDGQMYPVRVIERRAGPKGVLGQDEYEYYVHYEQFNRRLDTWVTIADMDLDTAETDDDKKKRKAEEVD